MTRIFATAIIYWIAGKLAVQMAIPPGYATAVWPAAGLALACVLIWGRRVVPGVLLGSILVNFNTSFDASSLLTMLRSIITVLGIGTGASLQAWLGAHLIRRYIDYPSPLEEWKDIWRFVILGGPVACVISPSFGVL